MVLDFFSFFDMMSHACTGFFMHKQLEAKQEEEEEVPQLKKANTWKVAPAGSQKDFTKTKLNSEDADKLAAEAGVPTLVMDSKEVAREHFTSLMTWLELLAVFGWYADLAQLRGAAR